MQRDKVNQILFHCVAFLYLFVSIQMSGYDSFHTGRDVHSAEQ